VRREHLLEDTYAQMSRMSPRDMRKVFRFSFQGEPGLDAGGVTREWYELVSQELFCEKGGFFKYSAVDNLTYQINTSSALANEYHLEYFHLAGRIIGKALMDGRILKAYFTLPTFKHIVSAPITLRDLESVDTALHNSLMQIFAMRREDIKDLCLDFTYADEVFGEVKTVELRPNGKEVEVTGDNYMEYVEALLRERMLASISQQLRFLLQGIYEVVPLYFLSVFDYMELELLLVGVPEIDVDDWKEHTVYGGDYSKSHKIVDWFWKSVKNLESEQRAKLLQFVTGTSRVPAHGFSALQGSDGRISRFAITSVERSASTLPKSSTCFNRLYLPKYSSFDELNHYILLITNMDVTGFDME